MAYQFKKKPTFSAIEKDKENLNDYHTSEKIKRANQAFGSMNINELMDTSEIIQKNIEAHDIAKIKLDLIKPREINDFDEISNSTLKASIQSVGLLNPILVRTTDTDKYVIISGHRRYSAVKELVADLKVQKAEKEKAGIITQEIEKKIKNFETIPAIVFTIVEDNSELLGSDPKYITKAMEEEMYEAANLETRQISKNAIVKNISYFYNLIQNNPDYKQQLLEQRNKTAQRKATKLNMPEELSKIITKDLKFSVTPNYIWKVVSLMESEDKYPKYYKKAMNRLNEGEKVNTVFSDFNMAVKVHEGQFEDSEIKQEYHTRMEKSDEPMVDIYNEFFNIKPIKKSHTATKVPKEFVENLLQDIKDKKISIDDAIKKLKKF